MTNPIIYYYDNGKIRSEHYFLNNKLHREDGPALISYYENGEIASELYLLNDKWHREDGPTYIRYYENGNIYFEHYYLNDKRHRENGPAIIDYYDSKIRSESYYLNNILYANSNSETFQQDLKKYHAMVRLKSFW